MRRPTTNAWKKGKESERRKRFWKSDGKDRDSTSRSAISFSLRFAGRVLFHLNSSFFSHSFMSFARLRFSLLTSWSSFYSLLLYLCFRREEKEDKLTHDSRVVRKQSLAHFRFLPFPWFLWAKLESNNRKPRKRKMKNESGRYKNHTIKRKNSGAGVFYVLAYVFFS